MQITKNTPLKEILSLAPACSCNKCSHGCKVGSGFLAEGDLSKLSSFLKMSEEKVKEKYLEETELFNRKLLRPRIERNGKPYGKCVFFDPEKGCRVHPAKPLQCRVAMGCKEYAEELMVWFMLNHIIDVNDPQSIREYAQYIKSSGKVISGGSLKEVVSDEDLLQKILNYEVLH